MATTISIGHATISENNNAYGTAGDQKEGNEVCIVDSYDISNLSPNVLLRPKSSTLAKLSAEACEAGCRNNHIGYSQSGRNTLYEYAKDVDFNLADVGINCNTDCSAFLTVCAIAGKAKITYGSNAPTTSNMRTRFKQSGDYIVLTDSKHLNQTDYLKRGDILVREGQHTVMVLGTGGSVVEDDDDTVETEGSTSITPITILSIQSIDAKASNISTTKAEVDIKIIQQKTGTVDKLIKESSLRKYKWSYILEQVGGATLTKQLKLASGQLKLFLSELKPNSTYMLRIIAKKDSAIKFCSQKVLFTTLPTRADAENVKQEFTDKAVNAIDHVYVKVDNEFKQAVIYDNS